MSHVFNKSSLVVEQAKQDTCPRCKGFGGCFPQDKDGTCTLCNGQGTLWVACSGSGWVRPIGDRVVNSVLW